MKLLRSNCLNKLFHLIRVLISRFCSSKCTLIWVLLFSAQTCSLKKYTISRLRNATLNVKMVEYAKKPNSNPGISIMNFLRDDFGIRVRSVENPQTGSQKYGKILPIDERLRKDFIFYLTKEHNIYSLGRFATWRQLLLDDVVKDVAVIENFLSESSSYNLSLHTKN